MTPGEKEPDMSLQHAIRGFGCAWNGVLVLVRSQRSARLHLIFTLLTAGLAAFLRLPPGDWCWLVLSMALVWSAEAFNTAVEFLSDVVCPRYDEGIRKTKDVAAAAVLFTAAGSVIIGFLILLPPLWRRAAELTQRTP